MARMLQALKNLEARSTPRPGPPEPAAASAPVAGKSADARQVAQAIDYPVSPAAEVASNIDFAAAAVASLAVLGQEPAWTLQEFATATYDTSRLASAVVADLPPAEAASARSAGERPARAQTPEVLRQPLGVHDFSHRATVFEKAALRVLTDPIRARPLVDLAERLEADIKQTGSRGILLAGVGSADDVGSTLLYTGMLMTERQSGDVVLIDADWRSPALTTAMERERQRGFGELIEECASIAEVCHPTATNRLFFLPAGQHRQVDFSTAGTRLEAALTKLSSRFALLLIHGGQAGELASSALARHADATYLVIRLGTVEAAAAQGALRDFRAAGARVLGCIAT